MIKNVLSLAIVPLYILACLVFGGSAQGIWTNTGLQLLAIPIISWALLTKNSVVATRGAKSLAVIASLAILLICIQIMPLPPYLWTTLPGRGFVTEGFRLLDIPAPWLAISLTPYETIETALTLLPPIAVLCAMLLTGAHRTPSILVTILGATIAAVLIGVLQVGSADPSSSQWYFYRWTNYGLATGFFANSNHMAALLMVSVPLVFALVHDMRDRSKNRMTGPVTLLILAAAAAVLLLGIVLGGSLAVILLGPPVLIASASILFPRKAGLRRVLLGGAAVAALGMLALLMSPLQDRLPSAAATSVEGRQVMWSNTGRAIADFMPIGSGISSFPKIYPNYEDPASISREYTSHAHNDYLELTLETGLPGVLLLIAFLVWWCRRAVTIWTGPCPDLYAQAATIASGALLFHSIVEFPLRTAALSAVMAAFLAIMARPRDPDVSAELWPTRHARL